VTIGVLACVASVVCAGAVAAAQPTPAPKNAVAHTAAKSPLVFSGQLRSFYFTRTNLIQNQSNPNRMAFNGGGKMHLEYHWNTRWTLGATYFFADPLGANGTDPGFDNTVDNTMPGFGLGTFGEAYVQFKSPRFQGRLGNQVINTPWANASDGRIKPVAFQGFDAQWAIGSNTTLGIDRMVRFESRTSSAFGQRSLITDVVPGQPAYPVHDTGGFLLANLTHKFGPRLTASAYYYQIYDLANLLYAESKYALAPASPFKPFVALQYAGERQSGRAYVGIIDNATLGAQAGVSLGKYVDLALGYDQAPWRSATVTAASCAAAGAPYFQPMGGTPDCVNNQNGTYTIYYGGPASPYTDNYATDPLYTTSLTTGMADRHSAGYAWKVAAAIQSPNKQMKLLLSEARYDYTNPSGANITREFNGDVTYFFSKVTAEPYHGLSIRHRYGDRRQPTLPFDFKYNRTQLQYDF